MHRLSIPSNMVPIEITANGFGMYWEGQSEIISRIVNAIDIETLEFIQKKLDVAQAQVVELFDGIGHSSGLKIPYQCIALHDGVDLCILLIKTTAQLTKYLLDIRRWGRPHMSPTARPAL